MTTTMKPVVNFEPLTHDIALKIAQNGWPVVDKIDEEFGAATVAQHCKAVWTLSGKRIEVSLTEGTMIVSQSKEIDPVYTERKGKK